MEQYKSLVNPSVCSHAPWIPAIGSISAGLFGLSASSSASSSFVRGRSSSTGLSGIFEGTRPAEGDGIISDSEVGLGPPIPLGEFQHYPIPIHLLY